MAVLVKDSKESDAANAKIMADIAKKVYSHYTENAGKNSSAAK
ncbi:hypothetical protein [Parasutterella excrementihominis]